MGHGTLNAKNQKYASQGELCTPIFTGTSDVRGWLCLPHIVRSIEKEQQAGSVCLELSDEPADLDEGRHSVETSGSHGFLKKLPSHRAY